MAGISTSHQASTVFVFQPLLVCHLILYYCDRQENMYFIHLKQIYLKRDMPVYLQKSLFHSGNMCNVVALGLAKWKKPVVRISKLVLPSVGLVMRRSLTTTSLARFRLSAQS